MADKNMDPQIVGAIKGVIESVLGKMSGIVATEPSQTKECNIIEYEGRMRVGGMEKFNAPSFISVVNFYLSQGDMDRHRAKGALVVYVDSENAGKLYNSLGFSIPDDEEDVSMIAACGELSNLIAGTFKNELVTLGYQDLTISQPHNYKNSVIEGVEFSSDQKIKHEFSFFYWRRKAVVVELTLAAIPQKR